MRAVRSGLEIVTAVHQLTSTPPLQVRIGVHTGPVVVGEIGAGEHTERLALGETPNVAARVQGLAEPNTVLISVATQRLIDGQFDCQPLGSHLLKGIDTPLVVYGVQSERQNASPLAGRKTLTPLVGREEELALLHRHWEQVKDREGQVAMLSGEPGIGKSRLVRELRTGWNRMGRCASNFAARRIIRTAPCNRSSSTSNDSCNGRKRIRHRAKQTSSTPRSPGIASPKLIPQPCSRLCCPYRSPLIPRH